MSRGAGELSTTKARMKICDYCGDGTAHVVYFRKPCSLWVCDTCYEAKKGEMEAMPYLF